MLRTEIQIMPAELLQSGHNAATYRDAAAKRIKALMQDWTRNTLALGGELTTTRQTFPINPKRPDERPGFIKWAVETTGLHKAHIHTLIRIYQKFGEGRELPRLGQQVMKMLSHDTVPASARYEAISRSERGEHITRKEAKTIIKAHLPTAKAANEQAKDEGRPVLARDGYIYFGTNPDKAKEGEDRRTMVYGVRKALDTLGNIQLTGRQFLNYAQPHQLWNDDESKIIKQALRWLMSLDEAWESRD